MKRLELGKGLRLTAEVLIPSVTAVIESNLCTTFQPLIRFFFYPVVIFAFWAGDFSERPVAVISFAVIGDALDSLRGER